MPHFVQSLFDVHVPLVFHRLGKAFCVRWVTNALEKLNAFLTLKFLELPVLFDELLLVGAELDAFQIQNGGLGFLHGGSANRLSKGLIWLQFIELDACLLPGLKQCLRLLLIFFQDRLQVDSSGGLSQACDRRCIAHNSD